MAMEMREGRGVGTNKDHIYLHLDHIDPKVLHERLPGITETGKIFAGVDLTRQPLPVTPTVHYNMGGIPTNYHGEVVHLKDGDPDAVVPGLFAVGEAACVSVHGANRLGSNSLIDLVVFGRATGKRIAEILKPDTRARAAAQGLGRAGARPARPFPQRRGRLADRARSALDMQRTMQKHCAVFRDTALLDRGRQAKIDAVYQRHGRRRHHRPLADLEHRPGRDARARQSARRRRW